MKLPQVLLAVLAVLTGRAIGEVPRFNATMTLGGEHRFVLISAAGQASQWLRLGDSFDQHLLKAYDAKASALELEREGKITRVEIMPDAAVKPVADATPSENRRVLESLVTKIPVGGFLAIGGQRMLVVGGKRLAVGTKFVVHYQNEDYGLELVGVGPAEFAVRFRGEEFNYPIKPAK